MAGSSPFTLMTNFLSLNSLNSVKTFRENSIVCINKKDGLPSRGKR